MFGGASDVVLQLREGLVYLVALVLSISVHEFGHAFVADRLGDPLPRAQERVTLNPISHIDPVGTLLLPLISFFVSLHDPAVGSRILGWGKPVRISLSARALSRRINLKTAHLLISLAGPGMNILFALVLSVVVVLLLKLGGPERLELTRAVANVVLMNIGLAFFNLIPCPPLDGGAVLRGVLPRTLEFIPEWLERYGFVILFALVMTGVIRYLMIPAMIVGQAWLHTLVRVVA